MMSGTAWCGKRRRFGATALMIIVALLIACQHRASQTAPQTDTAETNRQINVITSGGFAAAYNKLGPQFERETGFVLVAAYGASSGGADDSIPVRLARGETFDVIILSRPSLDKLTAKGHVHPDSRVDLVRSSIGMAVRSGAAVPDISTPGAFVQTLLDASSIGYSASASGTYLSTTLWPAMGIWGQIQHKSQRILSKRVASVVAAGDVEIGFQQISEILPVAGVEFAGPIPQALQKITTFSAGITSRVRNRQGAHLLITYLSSKKVAATIAAMGLEPVVLEDN